MTVYDLIVVGGGPAGLTSALYAGRAGLKTLVVTKLVGGQVSSTPCIENYPGIPSISGFDMSQILQRQVSTWGAEIYEGVTATKLDLDKPIKKITTDLGEYESRAVIISLGAEHRTLNIPGEKKFEGRGVSYCATCDGNFFKGKSVAVIGGGNTALTDASYLDNIAKDVHLIHRRQGFRAEKVLIDSLDNLENVILNLDSVVEEIKGDKTVEKITVTNVKTKEKKDLLVDGVFIAIGLVPQSKIVKEAGIKVDGDGYILHDENMQTNIEGVFTAGDITPALKQVAVAVGQGCTAAINTRLYLKGKQ
ncbi:MAG: thioredoxin-disulfide reductase [Candidatus Ranarchaeia archaeon]